MSLEEFKSEVQHNIDGLSKDKDLAQKTKAWFEQSLVNKYSYNFTSFSVPIIQYPQDMVALQELIWRIKPDLIIEAGIARGGSLIQSASVLAMIEYQEAVHSNTVLDPTKPVRKVLGLDIDIRQHNKEVIQNHFLSSRIDMIEGSSISNEVITRVHEHAKNFSNILVILDSNHTKNHVLKELDLYSTLIKKGEYIVVMDTIIEFINKIYNKGKEFKKGNSPYNAVVDFLKKNKNFKIDNFYENKSFLTVAKKGFLKKIR